MKMDITNKVRQHHHNGPYASIRDSKGNVLGNFGGAQDAIKTTARFVACWNACRGIPNPAAIPEVVDALRGCLVAMDELAREHGHTENPHMSCRIARIALAKLEGKGE